MGALQQLLRQRVDTVESLEGELEKLNAQGLELVAEIERLDAQKHDLEDEDEVLKAIARAQTARNRRAKLDARIAETRERLDLAKDLRRAKLRDKSLAAFAAAANEFVSKAWTAQEALDRLVAAREAIQAEGFRREYDAAPAPPAINGSALLAPELLKKFEEAVSSTTRTRATGSAAMPQPQAATRRKRADQTDATPALAPAQAPAAEPRPAPTVAAEVATQSRAPLARRPALREIAAEGERQFLLHRGIMPHPRNPQENVQAGDVLALTEDEALPIMRNGAGDFITGAELAKLDADGVLDGLRPTKGPAQ